QTYGSPRVWRQLRASGERCGQHRVARFMQTHQIQAQRPRKTTHTTDARHALPAAENILARPCQIGQSNAVWLNDITYRPTDEGGLYLAAVMDLALRKIIGWSMGASLERGLVPDACPMALAAWRPGAGRLHHSDQGVPYASGDYPQRLSTYGITPSMSRKGTG
ncbi:MAG: IS3 family transposase, partial [Armatimonadetes bacterium]|nr:IS3 family transposase [Armatimonadota bacterium]